MKSNFKFSMGSHGAVSNLNTMRFESLTSVANSFWGASTNKED